MKNKMMEFSLEKMGIENRIKRGRNQVLLNFDFGVFLGFDEFFKCRRLPSLFLNCF